MPSLSQEPCKGPGSIFNIPLSWLGLERTPRSQRLCLPQCRGLTTPPYLPSSLSPATVLWDFSKQQLLETAKEISNAEGNQGVEHCSEGTTDATHRTEDGRESLHPMSSHPSSPALSVTWNLLASAPSWSPWVVTTAARNACTTSWNSFGVR